MIHWIGSGGHASVCKQVAELVYREDQRDWFFLAIGNNRQRKFEAQKNGKYFTLIHPSAIIDSSATIGEGSIVMAGVVIQPHAYVGKHCIINTCASLDHHAIVHDFCHIAPGAHLCGTVIVEEGSMIGTGVCVAQNTTIPPWTLAKAARLDLVPL